MNHKQLGPLPTYTYLRKFYMGTLEILGIEQIQTCMRNHERTIIKHAAGNTVQPDLPIDSQQIRDILSSLRRLQSTSFICDGGYS